MTPEIPVLCFGPGLPPGGQRVTARVLPGALEVSVGPERHERVPWFSLQIASGGFDHQQMLLSWSTNNAQWSVMPVDAAARDLLLRVAPAEVQPRLALWNKHTASARRGFKFGWTVLGIVVLSPVVLVLALWLKSEAIVGWIVDQVSIESEAKLGKIVFAQVESSTPLVKEGPAVDMIRAIGGRLTQGTQYRYHWYVAKDPLVNAFAIPGGYVVVNSGLILAADNAEEVAGVLAHEVQHVERRHSLKGMVYNLGLSAALNLAVGDIGGSVWTDAATQLGTLKFGRDHESEADRLGLAALQRASIDPRGMLRFFEKLKKQDGATITLLSTHPATDDRLASLQRLVNEQAGNVEPLPYDWAAIKSSVAK